MMKFRLIAVASMVAVSALAGSAQALGLAGWDFSQYKGPGLLTIDGTTNTDTLPAFYGNGLMLMNGTQGSTNVDENSPNAAVIPIPGSPADYDATEVPGKTGAVASNLEGGSQPGDAFAMFGKPGQQYRTLSALSGQSTANVVFQANTSSSNWSLRFGGRTLSGTSTVDVGYSPNCTGSYTTAAGSPALLDATDTVFPFTLGAGSATSYCVRLTLGSGRPIVDNVAILPEPGSSTLLAAGALGVFALARRRGPPSDGSI